MVGVTLGELCLGLAEANCEPELINEVVDSLIEVDVAEGLGAQGSCRS